MAGPDPGDALSSPVPLRSQNKIDSHALRIGILESPALGTTTPETHAAVQHAANLLVDQGFTLEPFRLDGLERALELWWFFFGPVIGHLLSKAVAGKENQISPMLREYLSHATSGGPITLDCFIEACAERDLVRAKILRQMQEVPILLSPVSSGPAFLHGGGNYRPATGYLDTMRYSQWLNLVGFPGASVPLALSNEGLPIGVQIISRPHDDELVLAVAERLEETRGPWQSPPLQFP